MSAYLSAGDYAVVDGREWLLEWYAGRWVVVRAAAGPVPTGWTRRTQFTDERPVAEVDKRHGIVRVTYDGTYRGVPVSIWPGSDDRLTVYSSELDAAGAVGMRQLDRDTMVADLEAGAPELDVRMHRTRLPFPE
ncbi:hypothetical protein LG315_10130 [Microbacterium marinum]|uniref:hypothetical protein n=1 Tax=Microbacterium marinum TaxID=421115 RepID=UPI0038515A45